MEEDAWFSLAGWSREAFLERLERETPETFRQRVRDHVTASGMWTVAVGPEDRLRAQFGEQIPPGERP